MIPPIKAKHGQRITAEYARMLLRADPDVEVLVGGSVERWPRERAEAYLEAASSVQADLTRQWPRLYGVSARGADGVEVHFSTWNTP